MSHKAKMKCTKRVANMLNMICLRPFSCNSFWLIEEKEVPLRHSSTNNQDGMNKCGSHWDRCLRMPHTPVPVTALGQTLLCHIFSISSIDKLRLLEIKSIGMPLFFKLRAFSSFSLTRPSSMPFSIPSASPFSMPSL